MVFSCGTRACPKLRDRRVTNDPESTFARNTCRGRNLKFFRDGKQMPAGSKEKVSSDELAQCRAAACQAPRRRCLTSECHFLRRRPSPNADGKHQGAHQGAVASRPVSPLRRNSVRCWLSGRPRKWQAAPGPELLVSAQLSVVRRSCGASSPPAQSEPSPTKTASPARESGSGRDRARPEWH